MFWAVRLSRNAARIKIDSNRAIEIRTVHFAAQHFIALYYIGFGMAKWIAVTYRENDRLRLDLAEENFS